MRLTEKWCSFFGGSHYTKKEGVTEQDVIDKLGKIEDMGCIPCECPSNMVKVDFTPGTTIYKIDALYHPYLYSTGSCYRIYKRKATLTDCLDCAEHNTFGTKYFTNEEECWKKFRKLCEKEWDL